MESRRRRSWMLVWLLTWSFCLSTSESQQNCPGEGWTAQVWDEDPRLVAKDRSGERYEIGSVDDRLAILHVRGSPYELGRSHGVLLRSEIQDMYSRMFTYLEDQVISAFHLSVLPDVLARKLARLLINAALDATYLVSLLFTPARFVDEMIGLAQGAEVSFDDVVRIQMLPELTQATCSMLGSWGAAAKQSTLLRADTQDFELYQMRALDWDMNAPVVDYHAVIYYHPAEGNSFAIFTWAGFIGCVTGYSSRLGISEKVWLNYTGASSRKGMPWPFALRDVLQQTDNIQEAMEFLSATSRTCPLLLGLGSWQDGKFVLVGYSSDSLSLYDDKNFTLITMSSSPSIAENQFPGVVYVDKFVQPSEDECMSSLVQSYYGKLDSSALLDMASKQETGGMHNAVYDFRADQVLFSWAAVNPATGELVPAYRRNYVKLNMTSLQHPTPRCPPLSAERGYGCM